MVPVLSVIPDSPVARAGIQKGDFLIGINDTSIRSQKDYIDYAINHRTTGCEYHLLRDGNLMTIAIPLNTEEVQ